MKHSKEYKKVYGLDIHTGSNADIERQTNKECKEAVLFATAQEAIDLIRDRYMKGRRTYFTMLQIQTQHRREALITLASYRTNIRYLKYCKANNVIPYKGEDPAILNRYKDKTGETEEHSKSKPPVSDIVDTYSAGRSRSMGLVDPKSHAVIMMNLVGTGTGVTPDEAHIAIGILQGVMNYVWDEDKKVFKTDYIFSDGSKVSTAYVLKDLLDLASKGVSLVSCNVHFITDDGRIGVSSISISDSP